MKKMKKVLVMLALAGVAVSLGGCSKGDLPQEYTPTQEVGAAEAEVKTDEKAETEATTEEPATESAGTVQEQAEVAVLVMTAATGDQTIEGSEGLGFYGVYASGEDEAAVSEAISQGHFFATQAEDGPIIKATVQESMMGDSVSFKEGLKIKADISGLKSGSIVKVTNDTEVVFEKKIMGDKTIERVSVPAKGAYRVEVYTADGQLIALSNTITFAD